MSKTPERHSRRPQPAGVRHLRSRLICMWIISWFASGFTSQDVFICSQLLASAMLGFWLGYVMVEACWNGGCYDRRSDAG